MSPTSFQTAPPRVKMGESGFEPLKALPADLQSVPFGHSGILPYYFYEKNKSRYSDSNRKPADYKSAALPIEPHRQMLRDVCKADRVLATPRAPIRRSRILMGERPWTTRGTINGTYRARTYDPLLVRQMLSQLS